MADNEHKSQCSDKVDICTDLLSEEIGFSFAPPPLSEGELFCDLEYIQEIKNKAGVALCEEIKKILGEVK